MSTFKELIYQVREAVSGYNVTDDRLINNELIANLLNNIRSTIINQEKKFLDSLYYQRYACLEVKCFSDECEVDGITIYGNKIYYVEPPQLISGIGISSIKYLGSNDFTKPFTEIDITMFNTSDHRQYGHMGPQFARTSEKIFLKNYTAALGKMLTMIGLFFDPRDILSCSGGDDIEYPVPSEYQLLVMAKKDIFSSLGIVPDVINNAADDTNQVQQKTE